MNFFKSIMLTILTIQIIPAYAVPDLNQQLLMATRKGQVEKVEALLNLLKISGASINPNCQDPEDQNQTPLMLAAGGGYARIVALLMGAGASVNDQKDTGYTPLMIATICNHPEVIKQLLTAPNIDLNRIDNLKSTALMIAAIHGHTEIATQLLPMPKIDIESQMNDAKQTVLMVSALNNNAGLVAQLLSAGADVSAEDRNGYTVLQMTKNENILRMLRQATKARYLAIAKQIAQLEEIGQKEIFHFVWKLSEENQNNYIAYRAKKAALTKALADRARTDNLSPLERAASVQQDLQKLEDQLPLEIKTYMQQPDNTNRKQQIEDLKKQALKLPQFTNETIAMTPQMIADQDEIYKGIKSLWEYARQHAPAFAEKFEQAIGKATQS